MTEATPNRRFTGRQVKHQTSWSVRLADRVSSAVITVGGIGTIVCVSLVFVLLLAVVIPLFQSAAIRSPETVPTALGAQQPLQVGLDEYRAIGWALFADGRLIGFRSDTGEEVWRTDLLPDELRVTASSLIPTDGHLALARSDGTVQLLDISFQTTFLDEQQIPADLASLQEGQIGALGDGVVQVTPQGQFRQQTIAVDLREPMSWEGDPGETIQVIAHRLESQGLTLATLSDAGRLEIGEVRERKNVLTGETTRQTKIHRLPLDPHQNRWPARLIVTRRGENLYAIWEDGRLIRYDTGQPDAATVVETVELLEPDSAARVTAACLAIGDETLLVGDSAGHVRAWFRVRHANARTSDGTWLLPVHDLPVAPSAVTGLATSQRSRMLTAAYDDGSIRVFHATTGQLLTETQLGQSDRVDWVLMAPKDDGLLASSSKRLWRAALDPAFPEASFASLMRPIWYEGYGHPEVVWQSSFAGVQSEMKLGLIPLIFGTIKATVYSMLFGAPIALLAAIYTSEFLHPRWRTKVKSVIEMMASLPSVVLGFLGGLVIAPFVEGFVPAVLCAFFTIPVCFLFGAYLWQQLSRTLSLRLAPWRLAGVAVALVLGILTARWLGPWVERLLFAGDLFLWLDRQQGTGTGAWFLLWLPLSCLLVSLLVLRYVNSWLSQISSGWSRRKFGCINLAKFAFAVVSSILLALLVSQLLTSVGLDPRGKAIGTYVQRNALVVGFVMGFAVIPIIYTISEDALSTVPQHLRSASLGSGATRWQTAMRVVIPTAMSGLFSAMMIGLGRAVGETMIVLMAAGNTPVMDWNIFNGFRTLSANIAVELPEAVRDSTHYRTLFLAALTLLLMTFVINTVAELVRIRFRRRAVQL